MGIGLCHTTVCAQITIVLLGEHHEEQLVLFVSCRLSSDANKADTDGASSAVDIAPPVDNAPPFNPHRQRQGVIGVQSMTDAAGT